MRQIVLLAGAAALGIAGPALAKPGHGHGHGHGKGQFYGKGHGGCPPGHAKNPECMPPGQYKKLFNVGQRFPLGYGTRWGFNQIPYDVRRQYGFDRDDRYYYGDGYLYRVDPRTMLIEQVVRGVLYR